MENRLVLREDIGNKISILTINRPKSLNALNKDVISSLFNQFSKLENDNEISCVIITGSGDKAFVAGADIAELKEMNSLQAKEFSLLGHKVMSFIENFGKPVIAAINGYALGGGLELALVCDIRVASSKAKFGLPEITLGIIPGFGGTQRLPKVIGVGRAKEMIYTGKMIEACEAQRIGLVTGVFENDELIPEAIKIAQSISEKSGLVLKQAKECINSGFEQPIDIGTVIESSALSICFSTRDKEEGMQAFLKKRKPVFKNL